MECGASVPLWDARLDSRRVGSGGGQAEVGGQRSVFSASLSLCVSMDRSLRLVCQSSEVRRQESEVRGQRTKDRSPFSPRLCVIASIWWTES